LDRELSETFIPLVGDCSNRKLGWMTFGSGDLELVKTEDTDG